MIELLQHVTVTIVALGAGAVLVHRVFGFLGVRSSGTGGCDACPSSKGACSMPAETSAERPAVFIRAPHA